MKLFDKPGPHNTEECLEMAAARARELGIAEVVIATNSGGTALKAMEHFSGMKVIAVNHHAGFREPFKVEMPAEARKKLEEGGASVVIAAHALSGIERSFSDKGQGTSGF